MRRPSPFWSSRTTSVVLSSATNSSFTINPIISMKSGDMTGVEALIRWQHPRRGLVAPGEFIGLSEETGLIVPIGWWVLDEACRQLAEWQKEFSDRSLTVSVNLSGKQFSHPDLIATIRQCLRTSALEPGQLILELTETVLMENSESASETLNRLRALRVGLHIDDFGTGYSSLGYLHRLPIDTLKIDRSFVQSIHESADSVEIVRTIVTLARNLKIGVIAEGVQTREQHAQLQALSCESAQGFLYSQPAEPGRIREMLATAQTR